MKAVECPQEHQQSLASLHNRFVGDITLPESTRCPQSYIISHVLLGEEPLLNESKQRLVLFPIQYNEVRTFIHVSSG